MNFRCILFFIVINYHIFAKSLIIINHIHTIMFKFNSRIAGIMSMIGCLAMLFTSCSDDDTTLTPTQEPPTFSVAINKIERTSVDFTVFSSKAADYAYLMAEKGTKEITTAEEVFEQGHSSMLEKGVAKIKSDDVEGSKDYVLYVATRKINPYVYSQVEEFDLSTEIPYTKLLTMNKIGKTDFAYHVEVPENATNVKHLVVRKNDYEGVKSILGGLTEVTEEIYLKVFGLLINESNDFTFDKYGKNASGTGYDIHIHSDNTFLAMAGVVGDDGNIDPNQFECIEFTTHKSEVSPYDVDVAIETTSTTATITMTPDPEIVSYRVLMDAKSEYDYWRREGEEQIRYVIIGHWDDQTNSPKREYTGTQQMKGGGLIPNSQYIVGIVAFDAEGREHYKEIEFVTGEPTGPAPTLTVTETTPATTTMWNSKAYNVKATNAVEVRYGYWTKAQVDNVLNSGASMETIIQSNGNLVSGQQLAAILSDEGLTFETNDLQPETEYLFGIYARTDEYVTAVEYRVFTTEEMPQVGGEVRKNMPGNYIASTTDENGNTVTFPVTITTGVNDATTAEYKSLNRLVALGFGPSDKYPYTGPESITTGDANTAYGPKWFIEFTEDGIQVPECNKAWSMGTIDGNATYMLGYGVRIAGTRPIEMAMDQSFAVEVSEDGNTITVKGNFQQVGAGYYAYPAMYYSSGSGWFATNTYLFRCYSDLVLTRQTTKSIASRVRSSIKMPQITTVKVGSLKAEKARRSEIGTKIK